VILKSGPLRFTATPEVAVRLAGELSAAAEKLRDSQ
jgi:hypothetical protein